VIYAIARAGVGSRKVRACATTSGSPGSHNGAGSASTLASTAAKTLASMLSPEHALGSARGVPTIVAEARSRCAMATMYSVTVDGRLMLLRVWTSFSGSEADLFLRDIGLELRRGGRFVVASDLRALPRVIDPDAADRIAAMMRSESAQIERHALVLAADPNATLSLQIERMVKAGGSAARRTFRDRAGAEAWLAQTLKLDEKPRVAAFFDQHERSASVRAPR
jgi:hypothetical protein